MRKLKQKIRRLKKKIQRNLGPGVGICIIFVLLALVVLTVTLIVLNHEAIGAALESIPGAILGAIANFPFDWLISGAVGAALAFISCAIVWHLVNKPANHDDKE